MLTFRLARLGLLTAVIGLTALAPPARAADTVRFDVGRPLLDAQKLGRAGKHREALARLREADAVAGKTAFEAYQIERVRASAATGAGDHEAAIKAFEYVIDSGRLPAADAPRFTEALAGMYYRAENWPQAIAWIKRSLKDADTAPIRELLIQAYYLGGDYAAAASLLQAQAGHDATEAQLQLLANIQLKQNDKAGYVATLERLAAAYPKKSYWADLLSRVPGKPGFSERLALDVARLKLAHGLLSKPAEFMEMAQMALLADNPTEAAQVIEQGYRAGALGAGLDAARHRRLKDLAARTLTEHLKSDAASEAGLLAKKDADGLAALGMARVDDGQAERGLALMNRALAMRDLKHPDEARLHLGIACARAGKTSAALAAFKSVRGKDGAADLARYWIMRLSRPA